ncbi:HdeD family acid-resistance protein [Solitalea lacus]|uniref:HdeD family acid-resistance protein n=1 Tax=Solitalea lacus TaxID=2911172 RepID=UPI001EDA5A45|nr:HdeD family acid-resistance protein [Solitalea lacus]UKJ09103.1 HdeD family acid-resistance protein [Solitalea lacus]
MLQSLIRNWWVIFLRGLVALGFGIIAIIWPSITLIILLYFFGFYLIADGFIALLTVVLSWGRREDKWLLVLDGILSLGVGVIALQLPEAATISIAFMVGFWAIIGGIIKIAFSIHVRSEVKGEGWIAFSGVMTIIFGFLIISNPVAGAISLVWLIAAFSIVMGLMWVVTAFRIRSFGSRLRY